MRSQPPRRRGMTLIELLVVIGIIGVLLAILLPAVQKVRDAAHRIDCLNRLKQIGLALHHYHDAQHALPPGCSYRNGKDPFPHMSWCTRLLPFLEQEALWRQAQAAFAEEPFFLKNPPHTGLGTVVPAFTCPADGRTRTPNGAPPLQRAFTSYLGVGGIDHSSKDGLLFLDSRVRLGDVTDGTSTTLMVGERPPSADGVMGWWYAGWGQSKDGSADMVLGVRERYVSPLPLAPGCPVGPYNYRRGSSGNQCDAFHFWSLHVGGGHFLFADGSARLLPYSTEPVLPALATRAGDETVTSF